MPTLTRRQFVITAAAAAATVSAPARSQEDTPNKKGPLVCVFSKHLQFLDYAALAKTCRQLGLDGVDLTVRQGGHVEPAKLATDLPRALDALRSAGLEVPMISTRLSTGDDPDAAPILEAAAKGGIPYLRIGPQTYDKTGNPAEQLKQFTEELRGLAKLAEQFNVTLGYHNHSGYNNVGSPLWDLERMVQTIGSSRLGSNFDVGHAAVEGAYGVWQINARLMAPHVKMMAVKDFVWAKALPKWVPLGEGIVRTLDFMKIMKGAGFAGPISLHFEYKTDSNDALLQSIQRDAATLRAILKEAGYA